MTGRSTGLRRSARCRLVIAALVLVIGAATAPAYGFQRGGTRWPGQEIRYYATSPADVAPIRAAVNAWNRAGARIRLVASDRRRARVLIVRSSNASCGGASQLGYVRGRVARVRLPARCPDARSRALMATHELGHVLGLDHEPRRCATMNAAIMNGVGSRCADRYGGGRPRCGLLEPDDVRGVRAIYGTEPGRSGAC